MSDTPQPKCVHNEPVKNCGICEDIHALQNRVEYLETENARLIRENIVLRNEVNAARTLGDASSLALEYAREQWLDARRNTDEFDKEQA